jgi:hypothetical protein
MKWQAVNCRRTAERILAQAQTALCPRSIVFVMKGVLMDPRARDEYNERFYKRLLARRSHERAHYESMLKPQAAVMESNLGGAAAALPARDLILETIVRRERPVLFIKNGLFDTTDVTTYGNEAVELVDKLKSASTTLIRVLPLIGRVDVANFPNIDFLGTAWFVASDIVVTNRHVAALIAEADGRQFVFRRGIGGKPLDPSICNAHEFDDNNTDATRTFKVKDVLYIEPDDGKNDIAFVRVERRVDGAIPHVEIAATDIGDNDPVCVIGYPARATKDVIPDQNLMQELYRNRYDVKRAAPGFGMGTNDGTSEHDCTTLGGNSGSVVLNLKGEAVGLHFAGLYQQANYAVPASALRDYINRTIWNNRIVIRPQSEEPKVSDKKPMSLQPTNVATTAVQVSGNGTVSVTIPLTITVGLGSPVVGTSLANDGNGELRPDRPQASSANVEEAVKAYWESRPKDVLAARVGYFDEHGEIGDKPCIAASVAPNRWTEFEKTAPGEFQGVPIRYMPAEVAEQIASHPLVESVDSIAYDDDARTDDKFSFKPVDEEMEVTLHVGPEYSWEVLEKFLQGAKGELVSAMYEFHATHIKDAIEARLEEGAHLHLVLDNASFSKVADEDTDFDRQEVFEKWAEEYDFERIVAPEGKAGLISDSYHIKVTVRSDDTFWLSSGNWKAGSSQPIITQAQRDDAGVKDLPGNREWHVVIKNKTLATRFRSHILQDFRRSTDLGGREVPKRLLEETFVDVPIEEGVVLERRPPGEVIEPKTLPKRHVKVKPLLTPDKKGAVFSKAVLELIRSAKDSLLFQIPYIGMPSNPQEDRGFIDELINELIKKLKTLDDARVILRSGSQKYSSPTHAAWYFKSKGVDIKNRLHVIENSHTKGMIVDGKRVLVGSHNWSKPGVTLNRDASLIFDDEDVAAYYAQAFEIDWKRSDVIRPRRFVKREATILEAVGAGPPPGYRRVPLSELLKDD